MDGIPDQSDPAPLDSMNYSPHNGRNWYGSDVLGDSDNDGILNFFDVYPDDYYNGNPPTYVVDSDGDGMPDNIDPSPNDSSNLSPVNGISWGWGSDALGDVDGDGIPNYWDEEPYTNPYLDSDGDGVPDGMDPAPLDPDNLSPNNGRKWPGWKALEDWNNNGINNFNDPDPESGPTLPFTVTNPGVFIQSPYVFLNDNFDEDKWVGDGNGAFTRVPDSQDADIISAASDGGGRAVVNDMVQLGVAPVAIVSPYDFTFQVKLKITRADEGEGRARLHVISHRGRPDQEVVSFAVGEECQIDLPIFGIGNKMLGLDTGPEFWVEGVSPGKFRIEADYDAINLPSGFIWDGYYIFEYHPEYSHHEPVHSSADFEVLEPFLMADVDRDGIIDPIKDMAALAAARCLRHWVNDDSDSGEAGDAGKADVPGARTGLLEFDGRDPNHEDNVVNGSRDLVDFFPVLVRLPPVQLGEISSMRLRNVEGAFNVVFTKLGRGNARNYLKVPGLSGCGLGGNEAAASAVTHKVTSAGLDIPSTCFEPEILREVVLLVEASKETDSPLELVIEFKNGQESTCSIPVSAHGVEQMFRHVDLTGLAKEYDGSAILPPKPPRASSVDEPTNLPDAGTNGKYFVFVHGYNVDAEEARGWNAEIFKRFYALGSKARFVGVTWNGTPATLIPDFVSEGYPDYHKAVFQAFQTGDGLSAALGFMQGTDVTVSAHSLGNILVSHAIQSGGFRPSRYYMINAVIPMEALDSSVLVDPGFEPDPDLDPDEQDDRSQMARQMTESSWDDRNPRLFASNWHKLFAGSTTDARKDLKWADAFSSLFQLTDLYNFYSKGEDVVENPTSRSSFVVADMAEKWDKKRGAWGHQEMLKGGAGLGAAVMSRVQGGWSANLLDYPSNPAPTKTQAPDSALKVNPYFNKFLEGALFSADASMASNKAAEPKVRYDLLARGIPALSYAAAANKIVAFTDDRNFDMELKGRDFDAWPVEGHEGDRAGKWVHSDFKNVALPYVSKMYQDMISKGSLRDSP